MSIDVFYSRPGHLIRRLQQISVALFLEEIGHLDLTPRQYAVLQMVAEVPGIDQAGLSDKIAVDKTTVVKIIDRLVDKGWVTRSRSETDRRVNHLHVTAAGRAVLKQVLPLLDRSDQRILAPLSRAQQRQFMEMLTQLVQVNNIYSRAPMNVEAMDAKAANARAPARLPAPRLTRKSAP